MQALKVGAEIFNDVTFGHITALVVSDIHHFKIGPMILCSSGIYIDIYIKQIRRTSGFDLTKDELIKAGITQYLINNSVTFVEWEKL